MAYVDPNQQKKPVPGQPGALPGMQANSVSPEATTNTANPGIGTGADPYGSPKPPAPGAVPGPLADGNPTVPAATTNTAQPTSPDPFAASGGGTFINGGWIPNNNPAAIAAAGGTPGATPGTTANTAPTAPTIASSFQQALLSRMGQSPTVQATDASVAPQIQQNQITNQRGFERRRAMSAERAAQSGTLNSGGFDANLDTLASARQDAESQGQNQILGDANQQRRQEIMQALTMGGQYLSDQDRLAAQKELAQLDAEIRRQGLASQTALGQGDLALRGELGRGGLNLGLLQALMQNQQFGQGLSSNNAQFSSSLNQQALLRAMGM